ncbi:MAG TPA: hypothetical protein VHZ03_17110 [Trebonia sp.]|jgi:hypothetical protein|nr:hypothetical protein [Trebonia sp.]
MSSSSNARTGSSYDATVAHLRRVLGGFAPDYGDVQRSEQEYVVKVPPSKLPVAVLAREVMVVFGAADLGAADKVAWCYGFTVDGVPCTLASTKWGLRLHLDAAVGDADAAEQLAQRVLDKLAAAQRVVNKSVLSPQLADQIKAGNVTIANQYATLRGSYEYFREGAEQAYAGAGRLANRPGLADLIAGRGAYEGWWNTLAMVSAYFSTLEHILIGCLPFTSFDPATGNLADAIGDEWYKKMKRVVNITDPEPKRQFDALHDIAERFRNTYSHGAFGHDGRAAMSVHLPDVGAVPVALGAFGVRPELLFVPAVKDGFDEICRVFDSCDDWLANGPLADGHRWVLAGLDFRFDAQFRADVSSARSQGRYETFLSDTAEYVDDLMNMDI